MKGKKADPEFVSNFIRQCVESGIDTPNEIVRQAQLQIKDIDEEIKAIEKKKVIRSKLLDVVSTFDKTSKSKTEEAKLLSFFKLEYPRMCKFLCEQVKEKPFTVGEKNNILGSGETDPHAKFSIKQLLECKVLARVGDQIVRGDRFDEYMKFVIREV